MSSDKVQRQISIYFDTVEQKSKYERDANRFGITMSKLIKMALEVGTPAVLQSLRKMKKEQKEAMEAITEKTKVDSGKVNP